VYEPPQKNILKIVTDTGGVEKPNKARTSARDEVYREKDGDSGTRESDCWEKIKNLQRGNGMVDTATTEERRLTGTTGANMA